jgi:hypothetical protein
LTSPSSLATMVRYILFLYFCLLNLLEFYFCWIESFS